ncbi:MAG: SoxY-related AACIE arm protein [Bradyrhizobiaceae bacterium]|nr:SoxY-related AACIE arm protein [Bradyrhizobiaceae bacterium]
MSKKERNPTRRTILIGAGWIAGAVGAPVLLTIRRAQATPATMSAAIRQVVGEATVNPGKVKLDLPPLVENGNTVQYSVSVESPMTPSNHVKAIHVFNEKNPQPNIISVHLGPRAGRANFTSRMRLADSEKVVAIAEMSDGSFWADTVEVVVTIAACVEDGVP